MVRHVDDGFLVGGGCVAYVDGIVIGQGISNGGFYRPREAVVLVRRDKSELYCVSVKFLSVINLVLPAREPAMQTMSIVVPGKLDGLVSCFEASLINAVCITSDACAEVASKVLIVGIFCNIVIAQYHVMESALPVGYHDRHDSCAEVGKTHLHALLVGERVQVGLLPCYVHLKIGRVQTASGHAPARM